MRLGVLGATMAATVFELSGSFLAVLGLAHRRGRLLGRVAVRSPDSGVAG